MREFAGGRYKTICVLCILVAVAALPYFSSGLERFRISDTFEWCAFASWPQWKHPRYRILSWEDEQLEPPRLRPSAEMAQERIEPPLPAELAGGVKGAVFKGGAYPSSILAPFSGANGTGQIEDPGLKAMAHFYRALEKTARCDPGAVTRICHFGDSPLTGDLISGEARAFLQRQFGDAGHGFIMAGRPWAWYGHLGVIMESGGWRIRSPLVENGLSSACGLGGASFSGSSAGSFCRVETAGSGPGSAVGRFDIYYMAKPGGGTISIKLDGAPRGEEKTASAAAVTRVCSVPVPDGKHSLEVRPKGDGEVTLFGVALERDRPGIVYDSLGCNGASIHMLTFMNPASFTESLRLRKPDLVILNYGTNESSYASLYSASYRNDYREILLRVRAAVPEASIMIMSPMDRGERDQLGEIVTTPRIPKLVESQRKIAADNGCAFFNTFEAMGGEGTMARWYSGERKLVSGDLTHPSRTGAQIVAGHLVGALEEGFATYIAASSPQEKAPQKAPAEAPEHQTTKPVNTASPPPLAQ